MPTHLITGASIGGVNAASFAAHSKGYVGNAEPLLKTWLRLTPLAVGVDWMRYVWKVLGLIVASAGIGNLLDSYIETKGVHLSPPHPLWAWSAVAVLGLTLLYFYESVPYFGYVLRYSFNRSARRRAKFHLEPNKLMRSIGANALLWGSIVGLLISLGALTRFCTSCSIRSLP